MPKLPSLSHHGSSAKHRSTDSALFPHQFGIEITFPELKKTKTINIVALKAVYKLLLAYMIPMGNGNIPKAAAIWKLYLRQVSNLFL